MSNILFLMPTFPGIGGIEKVTLYLANEFCKNHNVYILAAHCIQNPKMLESLHKKVTCYILPNDTNELAEENILLLEKLLREKDITTLIFQEYDSNLYLILNKIPSNIRNKIRIIVAEHSTPMSMIKLLKADVVNSKLFTTHGLYSRLRFFDRSSRLYLKLIKSHFQLYKICDYYILLSSSFIKELMWINGFKKDKIRIIHNPLTIPIENVKDEKNKEIIYIGRLAKEKGIEFLIDIWQKIYQQYPEWKLKIYGKGPLEERVKVNIAEKNLKNIELCGFVDNILPVCQKAKFVLMTSKFEGWGLVLTEAMAYGCVPFAFNSYSSVYDIIDDQCGIVIPKFDTSLYAQRLKELMRDEIRWKELSSNCIKKARGCFSLSEIICKWNKIIQ